MFVTDKSSITIQASPEAIWDYAHRPENWTASNPSEHFGLSYDSPDDLPHQGTEFVQKESVAGMYAELHGRFHYMNAPNMAFWSGTASYTLLGGLVKVRIPEGGLLRLEPTEDGTHFSHDVYADAQTSLSHPVKLPKCTRRSSCALMATMTVLRDIRSAPTAGESTKPTEASTPAASGSAITL